MTRIWTFVALSAMALAPSLALAGGSVTATITPHSEITFDDDFFDEFSVDGNGFAVQGSVDLSEGAFAYGEYFDRTFEDDFGDELGLNTLRLGVGAVIGQTQNAFFWVGANIEEWTVEFDDGSDDDADGYGLRAGVNTLFGPKAYFAGEVGYFSLDDSKGFEISAGLGFPINERVSAVADYRIARLDDDNSSSTIDLNDVRIGLRCDF